MTDSDNKEQKFKKKCINCGRQLVRREGVLVCLQCNPEKFEHSEVLGEKFAGNVAGDSDDDYVFIDCPGATLYQPGSNNIVAGVKFHDEDDPSKGHEIVKEPVFAPTHTKRRRIKREAQGKIRRCQGCQDYTVRMRRPEGPDFFIPSHKHPKRTKLKSVEHTSYEPKMGF
jgi:hypothetical protein